MTIEVERDALLSALKAVISAVEARNTIPVLSNVLLRSDGDRLTIHATDLDLQISADLAASGTIDTTVPAAKLVAVVNSLADGPIKIEDNAGNVVLRQGKSRRTLPTLPSDDFPLMAKADWANSFTVPANLLHRLLERCSVAMSNEETRYYLNGVFLHVVDEALRGAATDGHRLIRAEIPLPDGAAGMSDIIVPKKAVHWLRSALQKREGEVEVTVDASKIGVTVGNRRLLSKLVDGTFPDYTRVIPSGDLAVRLNVFSEVLGAAAGCVAAVIDAEGDKIRTKCVRFELKADGCHQALGRDQTGAEVVEGFLGDLVGSDLTFGMNAAYLREVLGQFTSGSTVHFEIDASNAPARITSDKDADMIAVVMPMRV